MQLTDWCMVWYFFRLQSTCVLAVCTLSPHRATINVCLCSVIVHCIGGEICKAVIFDGYGTSQWWCYLFRFVLHSPFTLSVLPPCLCIFILSFILSHFHVEREGERERGREKEKERERKRKRERERKRERKRGKERGKEREREREGGLTDWSQQIKVGIIYCSHVQGWIVCVIRKYPKAILQPYTTHKTVFTIYPPPPVQVPQHPPQASFIHHPSSDAVVKESKVGEDKQTFGQSIHIENVNKFSKLSNDLDNWSIEVILTSMNV